MLFPPDVGVLKGHYAYTVNTFSIQPPGEVSHLGVPTPVAVRSGNQLTLKLKAKLLPSLGCDLVKHQHQVFFE